MSVQTIHDAVRTGRITPSQGALLLEVHEARQRRQRRRLFWYWFRDGYSLGPLRRWIARRWGR